MLASPSVGVTEGLAPDAHDGMPSKPFPSTVLLLVIKDSPLFLLVPPKVASSDNSIEFCLLLLFNLREFAENKLLQIFLGAI